MKPVILRLTPRAHRDIDERIRFVARFSGGKPEERRREIYAALQQICEFPERHPIEVRRRRSGLALRRHPVRQFAIIYAFMPATETRPWGIVTVRAIQHRRVRDVFFGVRENAPAEDTPVPYRTV